MAACAIPVATRDGSSATTTATREYTSPPTTPTFVTDDAHEAAAKVHPSPVGQSASAPDATNAETAAQLLESLVTVPVQVAAMDDVPVQDAAVNVHAFCAI